MAIWLNNISNNGRYFIIATQVCTFSSIHTCLDLSYSKNTPIFRASSLWIQYSGSMSALPNFYNTPGSHTKYNLYSPTKKTCAFTSASMWEIVGLVWVPSPAILNSSSCRERIQSVKCPQICSSRIIVSNHI